MGGMVLVGLSDDVLGLDGNIDPDAWTNAVGTKAFVGFCMSCSAPLKALPADRQPRVTWFTAACTQSSCGREMCSPSGRKLERKARLWVHR